MKKQILLTTLTIFALTSCSQNGTHEEVNTKETNELGVNIQIKASETRGTKEAFADKDAVGVFIVGKTPSTYTPKLATYSYDNTKWTGPIEQEKKILLDDNEAFVYGYYPSTATPNLETKLMPCSILGTQSFTATEATDYMYSTSIGSSALPVVSAKNTKAALNFHHALAKVSFVIYKTQDYPSNKATLTEIKLSHNNAIFSLDGNLSLETGAWTAGETQTKELKLQGSAECNNYISPRPEPKNAVRTAYGIFAPCSDLSSVTALFTINGHSTPTPLTTTNVTKWVPGNEYIYTLTLSSKELIINCTIKDWEVQPEDIGTIY